MRPQNYKVSHFDEIDSTNTQLAAAARAGAPDGTVYWADFQSAGRGRLDRVWEAPPGSCLMASVLLREPGVGEDRLHGVTSVVALSLLQALEELDIAGVSMKWPNDLVVGERKLAGVLAELVEAPPHTTVVVGFGVNVTYAGPAEAKATSLEQISGTPIDRASLLDAMLSRLAENRLLMRDDAGWLELTRLVEAHCSTIGQEVSVELGDQQVVGIACGLSPQGHLLVENDDGVVELATGDLTRVRATGA